VPGGFSIATLPWTPVGLLVAARDGGDRDQLHEEAAAMLVAAARGLRAEIPAETPAVLLAHWSVSGASTPTGAITDDFREVVLEADELNVLGFDAVVCGHIHKAGDFNGALGWMDVSTPRATHLPLDDAVVKVRYRATEEQARRIDWPKLRTLLDDCHKVFAITGDIVRAERSRVDGMDEDLPPLVAVDAWCDANEIADRAPLAELSAIYLQEVGA
jgi:hypothetical protein